MTGLILHAGGFQVSRTQLASVATPAATATHFPIPHDLLLDEVENALNVVDINVKKMELGLAREGARFFGILTLERDNAPDDYAPVLGLRNSHDKTFQAEGVIGSQVFVCDNLAFSGEFKFCRKHTRFIMRDLSELVMRSVSHVRTYLVNQDERLDAYKATRITDRDANNLIIELFRRKALNVLRIPKVIEQWYEPEHPEHAEDGNTVWRLFNAYTAALKGEGDGGAARSMYLPRQTIKAHALLDEVSGVTAMPVQEAA